MNEQTRKLEKGVVVEVTIDVPFCDGHIELNHKLIVDEVTTIDNRVHIQGTTFTNSRIGFFADKTKFSII